VLSAVAACAAAQETPVPPGTLDSRPTLLDLGENASRALVISGFAVASYDFDATTRENTFSPDALALAFFKPINDHVSLFAQLTTAREAKAPFVGAEEPGDAAADIDNLQIRWVPSAASGTEVVFGRFDSPLGVERDDAPLNFQATPSFTFSYARPVKFTGVQVHEAFSPSLEGWAILSNGDDLDTDNNKSKSGALYGMWSPSLSSHFGLGVIHGAEQEGNASNRRTTGVATLLLQPAAQWVLGGEAVTGREEGAALDGGAARWSAAALFAHRRFDDHWAATVRGDYLDDRDGARTGTAQRLTSLTISPQYLIGGGFYGVFRYLDRTTLRLPEFSLRLDLRYDRSTESTFASRADESLGQRNHYSATLQTVVVF
jgi:hypothetical protein